MNTIKTELFGTEFDLTVSGREYGSMLFVSRQDIEVEGDELSDEMVNKIREEVYLQISERFGDIYRSLCEHGFDYGYMEIRTTY